MRGLNRSGSFRNGNPVTLPKDFGNKVNWTPSPARFGNPEVESETNYGSGNMIGGTPVTPTFSPAAGTYHVPQLIQILAAGSDAIYFTVDGSSPTTSSQLYEGSVYVPASETVKAISVTGGVASSIGSAAYVIS